MTNLSYRVLLFTLAFAPLAFGSVEHWSLMTVELLSSLTLCLALVGLHSTGEPVYKVPGIIPLFLLLSFMVLQMIPMPAELLKIISPASWEVYQPIYGEATTPEWLPVSVNQKATLQEFLRIGAYVLFYMATIQLLRSGTTIKFVLLYIVMLASGIAFLAILQQFSAEGNIYWFRQAPGGRPGGPWVNINQYSGYIEMICPVALGLFLYHRPRISSDSSFRQRFVSFFSSPVSNLNLLFGTSFFLLCSSVLIALCRGGVITILLSITFFVILASVMLRNYGRAAFWVSICLVMIFITWLGWQPLINEFYNTFGTNGVIEDVRFTLWKDTVEIIKTFPLFGSGFGTYPDIYPSYKTITTNLVFDHAHNDYLELLTDGGGVGFFLGVWFIGAVLMHGWKKLRLRRDRFAVLVGIGVISGIFAVLLHSIVDFNMHNGAVGLYFFFLCGLLVAIVNTRYSYNHEGSLLNTGSRRSRQLLTVLSSTFFVIAAALQLSVLVAGAQYGQVKSYYVSAHLDHSIQ